MIKYNQTLTQQLNRDIKEYYPHIFPVTDSMHMSFDGVSRLVMLDRYTQKDMTLKSLKVGASAPRGPRRRPQRSVW